MRMILFVLLSNQSNHVTQGHLSVLETLVSVQSSFVWTEEGQNCPFLFPSLREQRENETMSIKPSTLCTWSHRQCRGRLKRPSPQGHFLGSLQRQGNTPHPYLMLPTEGGNDRLSNKSADLPFLHHFKLFLCSPKLVIIFFFFFFSNEMTSEGLFPRSSEFALSCFQTRSRGVLSSELNHKLWLFPALHWLHRKPGGAAVRNSSAPSTRDPLVREKVFL